MKMLVWNHQKGSLSFEKYSQERVKEIIDGYSEHIRIAKDLFVIANDDVHKVEQQPNAIFVYWEERNTTVKLPTIFGNVVVVKYDDEDNMISITPKDVKNIKILADLKCFAFGPSDFQQWAGNQLKKVS